MLRSKHFRKNSFCKSVKDVKDVNAVVYSSAIKKNNPEILNQIINSLFGGIKIWPESEIHGGVGNSEEQR